MSVLGAGVFRLLFPSSSSLLGWTAPALPLLFEPFVTSPSLLLSRAVSLHNYRDGLDLSNSNLVHANLIESCLVTASLCDANLTEVSFVDANLAYTYFGRANLSNTNFSSAYFRETHFDNAILTGASFTNPDVRKLFTEEQLKQVELRLLKGKISYLVTYPDILTFPDTL